MLAVVAVVFKMVLEFWLAQVAQVAEGLVALIMGHKQESLAQQT
jgi:hypothetical protein